MASTPLVRQLLLPVVAASTTLVLYPKASTAADEVQDPFKEIRKRKPIYDSSSAPSIRQIAATTPPPASGVTELEPVPASKPTSQSIVELAPRKPSPTDRVAVQVRRTRLLLHGYAAKAEDAVNEGMDRVLRAEHNFTSTVASLAPPKESNEKLVPGSIYVLVAAMAGSIISRNRNILIRFVTPLATGITAAHYIVPHTTQNVRDLVWDFEKRFPVIRDNHLQISDRIHYFIETGKAHSQMGLAMAEEKVHGVREAVEDLIRKGR